MSNNYITITIPVRPITKDNFIRRRAGGGVYRDERFKTFDTTCRIFALQQYKGNPLTGPLKVRIYFYFTDRKMPDLFNLPKSICDAMNGILWVDDRQIIEGFLTKRLSDKNQIQIIVEGAV